MRLVAALSPDPLGGSYSAPPDPLRGRVGREGEERVGLDIGPKFFFTLHKSSTRGNKFKLMKQFSRVNCRVFSFANRCIDARNSLSDDVVCSPF